MVDGFGSSVQKADVAFQDQAKKFGGRWKLLFFTCGAATTFSGVLCILSGLQLNQLPFDYVNQLWLTVFGVLMLCMDFPIENVYVTWFRDFAFRYMLFMTRFMGRGFWYLFLSTLIMGALWDNEVAPFIGFIIGAYVAVIAIWSMVYGWQLSVKLESVRQRIVDQGPDQWGAYIPPSGMTTIQFREMAYSLREVMFTDEELSSIVRAFSSESVTDDLISREEFEVWCRGPGMTIL